MDQAEGQLALKPVGKVVGGVAWNGQHGAATLFQQLGSRQQPLVAALRIAPQNGGGAVGNGGIAPDQGGQMLLVTGGIGAVQHPLIKVLGGLRAHTAQNAKALFHYLTFSMQEAYQPT